MESEMLTLWTQILPLYKQLYTYVRRRLVQYYGVRRIKPDGPIPAHILGEKCVYSLTSIKIIISFLLFTSMHDNLNLLYSDSIFIRLTANFRYELVDFCLLYLQTSIFKDILFLFCTSYKLNEKSFS